MSAGHPYIKEKAASASSWTTEEERGRAGGRGRAHLQLEKTLFETTHDLWALFFVVSVFFVSARAQTAGGRGVGVRAERERERRSVWSLRSECVGTSALGGEMVFVE